MATTARRPIGTFVSAYDDLALYELVRDVALCACPDAPTAATQVVWDAARGPAGHPEAPSARAICARLADQDGKPFSWRELLELAFAPDRDIEMTHMTRRREPETDHLTAAHLYYALRRAAAQRGVKTLGPDAYAETRTRLIAAARRRRDRVLEELLPTVGQIERIAGGWEQALELADLDPRATDERSSPRGMELVDALDLYAEATGGWLCSSDTLELFAREHCISLTKRESGKRWRAYLDEVTRQRDERGAKTRGYPPRGTKVETRLPEGALDGMPGRRPARGSATKKQCAAAVRRYLDDPDRREPPSQKRYLAWSVGRDDAPAPSQFAQYGGWRLILAQARRR